MHVWHERHGLLLSCKFNSLIQEREAINLKREYASWKKIICCLYSGILEWRLHMDLSVLTSQQCVYVHDYDSSWGLWWLNVYTGMYMIMTAHEVCNDSWSVEGSFRIDTETHSPFSVILKNICVRFIQKVSLAT